MSEELKKERVLHATCGLPVPARLQADFAQIAKLPRAALERLWEVLGPYLGEPPPADLKQLLVSFSKRYSVQPEVLGESLRALRWLFREAARWTLPPDKVAADLRTVLEGEESLIEPLMLGYEPAMKQLHREITYRSVADHGRLLSNVTWRVDQMLDSTRGQRIDEPLASLTFSYTEGVEVKRITLQALPREVEKLRDICSHILG